MSVPSLFSEVMLVVLTVEYYRSHETWAGKKEMCCFYKN